MWSALGGVDTGASALVGKGLGGLAKLAEDFENNMDGMCARAASCRRALTIT